MWIKTCLMIVLGLAAGGAIAGAYVAFLASLGVYTRLESWANQGKHTMWLETLILLGTTVGNLLTLYEIPIHLGQIGLAVSGLFFGMFIGCLAGALAENRKQLHHICQCSCQMW